MVLRDFPPAAARTRPDRRARRPARPAPSWRARRRAPARPSCRSGACASSASAPSASPASNSRSASPADRLDVVRRLLPGRRRRCRRRSACRRRSRASAAAASASAICGAPSPLPPTLSMNSLIWLSGIAPMKPSTGWPFLKAMTAGIDWMPSWPAIDGMVVDVHLDQLDPAAGRLDRPFRATGVSCLHGPHHGAQKSTSTGWLARFLDDVGGKARGRRVLDDIGRAGAGGCAGSAAPPYWTLVAYWPPAPPNGLSVAHRRALSIACLPRIVADICRRARLGHHVAIRPRLSR